MPGTVAKGIASRQETLTLTGHMILLHNIVYSWVYKSSNGNSYNIALLLWTMNNRLVTSSLIIQKLIATHGLQLSSNRDLWSRTRSVFCLDPHG